MNPDQVADFVRRIRNHVASDPDGRAFEWWAKNMGLLGADYAAVVAEHKRQEIEVD